MIKNNYQMNQLAIHGGNPVNKERWPVWPDIDNSEKDAVLSCLQNNRWTISGLYNGKESYEAKFAKDFASFNNAKYCIPTASGTTALISAMKSLHIGEGDEVIIPAMTWVACASTVLELKAKPVIVDIDPNTLCISPLEIQKAINKNTKAIMVVHLYSAIANMDEILKIGFDHNIFIIEDCAQSHGAIYDGKKVGTLGIIGAFSMQQGKVLTSGEGGACITNDPLIYESIYRNKTNGRVRKNELPQIGEMELEDVDFVNTSQNYCLSEIQCALLIARLKKLEDENLIRYRNKKKIELLLQEIEGVEIQETSPKTNQTTTYHLPIKLNKEFTKDSNMDLICGALSAELGTWVHKPYLPLNHYEDLNEFVSVPVGMKMKGNKLLPNSWEAHLNHFVLHHSLLLAEESKMQVILDSLIKIKKNLHKLR